LGQYLASIITILETTQKDSQALLAIPMSLFIIPFHIAIPSKIECKNTFIKAQITDEFISMACISSSKAIGL
jgi:hypothetical protein